MFIICFIILIISTLMNYKKTKSILAPGVILGLIWSLVYFLLINTTLYVEESAIYYYVVFCTVAFQWICYFLGGKKYSYNIVKNKYVINDTVIIVCICIYGVILVLYLINVLVYLMRSRTTLTAIVYTLKIAQMKNLLVVGKIVPYAATSSFVFNVYLMYVYFRVNDKGKLAIYLLISFLISGCFSLFMMGRVFILQLIVGCFFCFVFTSGIKEKRIIKYSIFIGVLLVGVFMIYGISKFYYRLSSMSIPQMIDNTLSVYVAGPIVGMQILLDSNIANQIPKQTLSFFYSLGNALGGEYEFYETINYLKLGSDSSLYGNVYTMFYYWIVDYGYYITFLFIVLLAIYYGLMYKKMQKKDSGYYICIMSFSYYPLLMQFFDEQYMTQMSLYIQIFFWSFLFFRTNLLGNKVYNES